MWIFYIFTNIVNKFSPFSFFHYFSILHSNEISNFSWEKPLSDVLGFWVSISDVGSINIKRFEYSSNLVIKEVGIKKKIPSTWNENKILICCPLLQFLNYHPSICNIASNHYLCKKIRAICVTIVISQI